MIAMHAIIIEVALGDVDREAALKGLREQVVPRVSGLPGFQSGTWLRPNEDGKGFALILFDGQEDARAAFESIQPGANPQPGVTVERSEMREVAAQA
jgi:hypothetical protein